MVRFTHKGYCVVNPWMDEKTQKEVDPYQYYGKEKTDRFIRKRKNSRRLVRVKCLCQTIRV